MKQTVLVMALACGCGRVGFDGKPELLDVYTADGGSSGSVSVPVTLASGDLVIAAIATIGPANPVMQMTDDIGNAYVSAGARAVSPGSTVGCEIWYVNGSKPGTGTLTATAPVNYFSVWVAELSGVAPGPPLAVFEASAIAPAITSSPQVTTTGADEVVFALLGVDTFGAVPTGVDPSSPFAALDDLQLGATAYYVAATDGDYAAAWDVPFMPGTCSSIVAFAANKQ
ncbi:MAG TPA: hypothetical protein VMJ10_02600 [Kofleriaceae bacterium]|nr:hypothetical protein [Kofleriaceae bacterium]